MPRADHAENVEHVEVVKPHLKSEEALAGHTDAGIDATQNGSAQTETIEVSNQGLSSQTDHELLAGLRLGSELHFSELYNRYFQRIYSFVYTRIRNHADAEEVVQETFTVVFRSCESFRGTSSLLSWIYGIAKNTVNNSLRRAKTEGQRLEALTQDAIHPVAAFSDYSPEDHLNLRRYAQAIDDRLESIAPWQTEIFVMRHLDNLSIQEISERTDRSSDAIRSSLYRVKRLLFETAELSPGSSSQSARS